MKIHLPLTACLLFYSLTHPFAMGRTSTGYFSFHQDDFTAQALAVRAAAMGGTGLIQWAHGHPIRGEASPAKGVGDRAQLQKDFDEVIRLAQSSSNPDDFEELALHDLVAPYSRPTIERLLGQLNPLHVIQIREKANVNNPDWLMDTFLKTRIYLVRNPQNRKSPFMVHTGWDHVGVATWRWDPKTEQGMIFLSRGYVEEATKESPRILQSLLLYELVKVAAARENSKVSTEAIDEAAADLEKEVAGTVPTIRQTRLDAHISQVADHYNQKFGHSNAALFIVHANVPGPHIQIRLPFIQKLLSHPFRAVYENMGGISRDNGGDPPTLDHAGWRYSFLNMLSPKLRVREKIQVFVGGQTDWCLLDQIEQNLWAIKKSHTGTWTFVWPLESIFDGEDRPVIWSESLLKLLDARFSTYGFRRGIQLSGLLLYSDGSQKINLQTVPTVDEALKIAFPRSSRYNQTSA